MPKADGTQRALNRKRLTSLVITLKSRREIGLMREASRLVVKAHQLVNGMLEPGVTTAEIDAAVERHFEAHSATPLFKGFPGKVPFPAVTCISINEQIVHGIPGDRRIEPGDIVSVDTGCKLNGWCGDAAWTYPVGDLDPLKQRLLTVGRDLLFLAVREMGRCRTWTQVARLMQNTVRKEGFSLVEDFVGHGIGQEMHEDPQVPNYVNAEVKKRDFRLEPGLVLAIEPMVAAGTKRVVVLSDQWTAVTKDRKPSVHFEHTVALTADGPQILTEGVGEGGL